MFRIRYNDQGKDVSHVVRRLDVIAQSGRLEIVWIVSQGSLALLAAADPGQEALLVEEMKANLPGPRLVREDIGTFLDDLQYTIYLGGAKPPSPVWPDLLLGLDTDAALSLTWNAGKLSPLRLAMRDVRQANFAGEWPGVRSLPGILPQRMAAALSGINGLPSELFSLPASGEHPTLSSRNVNEIAFSRSHGEGLLLGSDKDGRPVRLPMPISLVWAGTPAPVADVCTWMSQQWRGKRVVVLDASPTVRKDWQDTDRAGVFVSWAEPGCSAHLNPLARLGGESAAAYTGRAMDFLDGLGVTQQALGHRAHQLLWSLVRMAVEEVEELGLDLALEMLREVEEAAQALGHHAGVLPEDVQAIWRTSDWRRDKTLFSPAYDVLRTLIDRVPETGLWFPPYTPVERLIDSAWTIIRIPHDNYNQRAYWAGMWPLFEAVFANSQSLVFALGLGTKGKAALAWTEKGASVLAWGRSPREAIGSEVFTSLKADLVVGAETDPSALWRHLAVESRLIAAQAPDQAIAGIGGDVGSITFSLPKKQRSAPAGLKRLDLSSLPPLVSIVGDGQAARVIAAAILGGDDKRVLIAGQWVQSTIKAEENPQLNPLSRSRNARRDAFRWAWWGQGLGLPAALLRGAYHAEVGSMEELYAYVKGYDERQYIGIIESALDTECFGAEDNIVASFAHRSSVWVKESHPAVIRALAMAAVEARARLVVWDALGLLPSDLTLLQKVDALVYPYADWVPNVLATRCANGSAEDLPAVIGEDAPGLSLGEAILYVRQEQEYVRSSALVR